MYCGIDVEFVKTLCGVGFKKIPCVRIYPRMIKSLFVVYCNIIFHVAEAKIIRHINKALHDETLAHFLSRALVLSLQPHCSKNVQLYCFEPLIVVYLTKPMLPFFPALFLFGTEK